MLSIRLSFCFLVAQEIETQNCQYSKHPTYKKQLFKEPVVWSRSVIKYVELPPWVIAFYMLKLNQFYATDLGEGGSL